jgi:hypothetical protein
MSRPMSRINDSGPTNKECSESKGRQFAENFGGPCPVGGRRNSVANFGLGTLAIVSTVCLSLSLAASALADDSATSQRGASASLESPESDRPDTLFGGKSFGFRNHMYIAPALGATSLNGHAAYNIGLRAAYLLNDNFAVGLAAYGMGWDGRNGDNRALNDDRQLSGGYGGVLIEYRLLPQYVVHGVFDTTIGGGGICTRSTREDDCADGRGFGFVEPTASVELNLTDYMRITLGGGYRFAFASERDGISGSDLSGFVGRSNLEFGWF